MSEINGNFVKPPLELGHGLVITFHMNLWYVITRDWQRYIILHFNAKTLDMLISMGITIYQI